MMLVLRPVRKDQAFSWPCGSMGANPRRKAGASTCRLPKPMISACPCGVEPVVGIYPHRTRCPKGRIYLLQIIDRLSTLSVVQCMLRYQDWMKILRVHLIVGTTLHTDEAEGMAIRPNASSGGPCRKARYPSMVNSTEGGKEIYLRGPLQEGCQDPEPDREVAPSAHLYEISAVFSSQSS